MMNAVKKTEQRVATRKRNGDPSARPRGSVDSDDVVDDGEENERDSTSDRNSFKGDSHSESGSQSG